ncbi:MAG: phosphotransferase [Marinilabiliaceae bacterium]|nr:phosphotransferase [Marinilabiliaceae bacterium]
MKQEINNLLKQMFEDTMNEEVRSIVSLPPSGSYREYFRISGKNKTALGVYNQDLKENKAFISFSESFKNQGLNVPSVYAKNDKSCVYLIEDLGDITLFAYIQGIRKENEFPDELLTFYKKVIDQLIQFQLKGSNCINYNDCYPRQSFDKQSMLWDLHYFKYYFLKLAKIPFDEQLLEDDFNHFCDFLLEAENHFFLYRDFQSRNIMIMNDTPWFIDYQGGRKGALQYDIASLLYDAKANLTNNIRNELLNYYISQLKNYHSFIENDFRKHYWAFVLIRLMQALGAYGFRGFYEKKEHFLQSIPLALVNLENVLNTIKLPVKIPILLQTLKAITQSDELKNIVSNNNTLTVSITSFSYKKGIPIDISGNGGGFVFDCRSIHNPGKYEQYQTKTGKDIEIIDFFKNEPEMQTFLNNVFAIVDQSVEKYIKRQFNHLMINFGCTGGQHRSVYSAERLAKHLKSKYKINIQIKHVEQDIKPVMNKTF